MKLLIVDDEELTRTGLIGAIDWDSLGITEVRQAEDGAEGLRIARGLLPDIVLCDVRMPRMDGIQMVERLEKLLPCSAFIFMSGYSDKEYLKAAIRLKAVNYVEKPLNPVEVREAVRQACENVRQNMRSRKNEQLYSRSAAAALAALLTRPYQENKDRILSLAKELGLSLTPDTGFTAFLLKAEQAWAEPDAGNALLFDWEPFLSNYHMRVFYVAKHNQYHVFFLCSTSAPSGQTLARAGEALAGQLTSDRAFYIARGGPAAGIGRAYQSYTQAVALMQSSFYYEPGTILTPGQPADTPASAPVFPDFPGEECVSALADALLSKNADGCSALLTQIYGKLLHRTDALPHQARDLYYKLFNALEDCGQQWKLSDGRRQWNVMEFLENSFSVRDLHETLVSRTEQFFETLRSYVPEDSTIYRIKDYIGRNYANENLSVRDIGESVSLSVSYVCTYFKNETGMTLNQYLTNYRMEKAKQLLADPRYQITDVSARVGYSNGNYFSKSFKKFTNLSPSEYREKMMV